jgi:long-chain fatty acid transport protein
LARRTGGALLTLLALAAPAAATNGPKLTAVGPRAAGRGGVDYAYSDDGIGPYNNPAGMAFVYGNRFDNNWAAIRTQARFTLDNLDGFRSEFNNDKEWFLPVPAFSFGVTMDPSHSWEVFNVFKLGDWGLHDEPTDEELEALAGLSDEELRYGSPIRIGFGVFPVSGGVVKMDNMLTPGFGVAGDRRPVDWEANVLALAVTPSFAVRLAPWISAGVALQIIHSSFELDGGIAQPAAVLRDDFELANSILSINPQVITEADLDDAFTWGFSWRVGIMLQPTDFLSIGIVYQDRSHSADYLGRALVDSTDEINRLTNGNPALLQLVDPQVDPSRGFTSEYDLRIQRYEFARQFGIGIAIRPHRRFSIGIDYTFIHYEESNKTFRVRLSNGSNPNMDIITSTTIPVRVPLRFENQHVIAFGLSWLAVEGDEIVEGVPSWALMLRTGFNYGQNPIPEDTTLPQVPAITEHHIMGGASLIVGPYLEFSFSVTHGFRGTNPFDLDDDPLDIDQHVGDYTLSNATQGAAVTLFQFGIGVNF